MRETGDKAICGKEHTMIAKDFFPFSRRIRGRILYVFGLWRNTDDGEKGKQDGMFIFANRLS